MELPEVTHIVHWIPPELIRTRKWFGHSASPGYWELQSLDAYESARHGREGTDFIWLDNLHRSDVPPAVLTQAVSRELGCPAILEEQPDLNGKGSYLIPGLHRGPVRWADAPVYAVRTQDGCRA